MGLWISGSGESEAVIEQAVETARRKLREMGVTPEQAYQAHEQQAHCQEYDHKAELAWERAELEAFRTMFKGRPRWPETASLVYEAFEEEKPKELWVSGCCVSEEVIKEGVAAAQAKMESMGIDVQEAYKAHSDRSHQRDYNHKAELAWELAELAAFRVMFKDLPRWPEGACMVVH